MSLARLNLAKAVRPAGPPDGPLELTYGEVTATDLTASPPTITINVDGFTVANSNVVWPQNSYTPAVNDTVIVLLIGVDAIVLGTVPAN